MKSGVRFSSARQSLANGSDTYFSARHFGVFSLLYAVGFSFGDRSPSIPFHPKYFLSNERHRSPTCHITGGPGECGTTQLLLPLTVINGSEEWRTVLVSRLST